MESNFWSSIAVFPGTYRLLDNQTDLEVASVTVGDSSEADLDLGAVDIESTASNSNAYDLFMADGQVLVDSNLHSQGVYFVAAGSYQLRVGGASTIVVPDIDVNAGHVSVVQ